MTEKKAYRVYDHEAQHQSLSSQATFSPTYLFQSRKRVSHTLWLLLGVMVLTLIRSRGRDKEGPDADPFLQIPQPNPTDRLTAYATWTGSTYKEYLRHFIYSAQQNADMLDVVFVNRKGEDGACVDFENNEVKLPEGGNFHHVCLDDREWTRKHADFLCAMWSCNEQDYEKVWNRLDERLKKDHKNSEFHPFLGQVFGEYNPSDTPYWAWTDVVSILVDTIYSDILTKSLGYDTGSYVGFSL